MRDTAERGTLAIIAGSGSVPLHVAAAATAGGRPVFILGVEGEADDAIAAYDHAWLNWGQVGSVPKMLGERGAREVVLVGGIKVRPDLTRLKLDFATLAVAKEILAIAAGGDDEVLSSVIAFIEKRGLRVIGAHEVATDLVAGPGPIGARRPGMANRDDIRLALRAARTIGMLDAGQAAVVVNRHPIALEGTEGTDRMLERVRELRQTRGAWTDRTGVLAKCAKPHQDLRIDMPAIGPRTIDAVAAAGLAGVAVEAGRVMITEREETIRRADAAGLFVVGETVAAEAP
jgi:DUF1009 family protein